MQDVRNVAVVGRTDAGKTALVAALTRSVGVDGPTHGPVLSQVEHRGVRLALLDTPGHPELGGAVVAALRAADAVLFVVPAVGGLDPVTAQVWDRCEGRPRVIAVTRLDDPGADTDEAVALCQRLLDEAVLPLQLPMHDDGGAVAGLLTLLDLQVVEATGSRPADPEHRTLVAGLREDLLETVLAASEDDALLDGYLDGSLAGDEPAVVDALHTAVRRGDFAPVVVVSARTGVGLPQLLDLIVDALPGPHDAPCPDVQLLDGELPDASAAEPLACDPDGVLAAEIVAPGVVRIWSGTLAGIPAGTLTQLPADRWDADLPGPGLVDTGLLAPGLRLAPWDLAEPQLPVAVLEVPEAAAADPSCRVQRDADTGQDLLWCAGPHHAALLLAGAEPEPLQVPRRVVDRVAHERWVGLVVAAPTAFARAVGGDLGRRRAVVTPPEPDPDDDERSLVRAELPWAELAGWAGSVGALTYGTARVTRTDLGWRPV